MSVYFIKPIDFEGPIKIGCSQYPNARRISLNTWSPFLLEIVATYPGGIDIERRFHRMFYESHKHSEWFEATPELYATIDQINNGTFTDAMLPKYGGSLKGMAVRIATYEPIDYEYLNVWEIYTETGERKHYRIGLPSPSAFSRLKPAKKTQHLATLIEISEAA